MSRKLVIQLLVLAGIVGAGALGVGVWQRQAGAPDADGRSAAVPADPAPQATLPPETAPGAATDGGAPAPEQADAAQAPADAPADTAQAPASVPTFDLMRVEPDGSAVVAGRAEAGSLVALLSNGRVVGKGLANAAGEFAIVLDTPLEPGAHAVTLETQTQGGETLSASQQSLAVSVPQDPASGEVLVMLNEPGAPSQLLQRPEQLAAADSAGGAGTDAPQGTPAAQDTPAPEVTQAPQGAEAPQGADAAQDSPAAPTDTAAAPAVDQPPAGHDAQAARAEPPQTAPSVAAAPGDTPAPQADAAPAAGGTEGGPAAGTAGGATGAATAEAGTVAGQQSADAGPAATGPAATAQADTGQASAGQADSGSADTGSADAAPAVRVDAVETEDDKVFVAGAGEPGSDVRVYLDNKLVGEARTDAQGRWLVEGESRVAPGQVEVRADQVAQDDGRVTARAEVTFEKEAPEAIALRPIDVTGTAGAGTGADGTAGPRQIPSVIIRTGDNLWTISQRRYGAGIRYTTIYQANRDQIRNPDLIYPGQVFMMPEGDRNWPQSN